MEEIYQATEGFIAYTCRAGRLHLNEAFLHVEPDWIDEAAGLFSPIITDFSRETQPIVRYRLDDVLRLDRRACPCGSPEHVLERVEGRADDVLELPAREPGRVVALLPDFVAVPWQAPSTPPAQLSFTTSACARPGRTSWRSDSPAVISIRPGPASLLHLQSLRSPWGSNTRYRIRAMCAADFLQKRRRISRERLPA